MAGEIILVLCLIILNGIFAMSEIAIISSRKSKLEDLMRKGNKKAKAVLSLIETPSKFLSTIQIGITSIAILIGFFGSRELTLNTQNILSNYGMQHPYDHNLAVAIVVICVTFLSIVIGELIPKRIGMTSPEAISLVVVKPIILLLRITAPFVWLLSFSTDFVFNVFGIKKKYKSQVTEGEIKALIEEGTNVGEIQEIEQDIVERVFHLGDQRIAALMTNRADIVWLNVNDTVETTKNKIAANNHSIYPLCNNDIDDVLGIVYSKDLFNALLNEPNLDLKKYVKPASIIPSDHKAYQVLEKFKESKIHFAVVVDEYGAIEGVVTINDILDALVGDITGTDEPEVVRRSDGSWLIDGRMAFFEFIHEFEIENYDYSKIYFHSMGGFVVNQLKAIPKTTDKFDWHGYRFEILDMDGNRVDKILLTKIS
ncbi:MAG: hemolysin family protein [Bacteroidales bacterium]|nr:hemolysin family protein [Bacteroidales bacterium]